MGNFPQIGKRVAVIGAGNVAMDVCRTAVRLGAEETYIVYRRSQAEMPADAEEAAEAMEEGVKFKFLNAPVEILGENDKVVGLKVELMELGEPDEKGRRKPVGTGAFETIPIDTVIGSIGQRVVRETGGLRDTVQPYNQYSGEGNGFSFANFDAWEMRDAVGKALSCYKNEAVRHSLIRNAMEADFGFELSAQEYARLYIWML